MSTYSLASTFFISFGGTEPNPGRSAGAAGAPGAVVAGVDTTDGHAGRDDGPAVASPLAEGMAKMGSRAPKPAARARKTGTTSGAPRPSKA